MVCQKCTIHISVLSFISSFILYLLLRLLRMRLYYFVALYLHSARRVAKCFFFFPPFSYSASTSRLILRTLHCASLLLLLLLLFGLQMKRSPLLRFPTDKFTLLIVQRTFLSLPDIGFWIFFLLSTDFLEMSH